MDDYKENNIPQPDAPGSESYYTGNTKPPKSRRGLIAVLLVAVIFLGGLSTALGLLNVRMFRQLSTKTADSVVFSQSGTPLNQSGEPNRTDVSSVNTDVQLNLQNTPQSPDNISQAGGLSLQSIYEKCIASVVSISCRSNMGESSGTGVVISSDGYIVTNCHVVEGAQYLRVLFSDGRQLDASIVGTDAVSDLAVLHVYANDLIAAEFGNSDTLRVGDTVVAIGDPLGVELRGTMTDGIVSAINRDITTQGRPMTLIQTNAALNSGNSGGPLINCYGQVIGINTMKIGDYMSSAGVEGLGFAIPSVTVEEIVNQLLSQGYVSGRPDLGIACETVSSFLQIYYNIPQGVYITAVSSGSNAQQLGISAGDIILSFDGVRITDTQTLNSLLYTHNAYDTVPIVIYRSGNQYQLTLTLDEAK